MSDTQKHILIVAGEASADRYGARLVEKLKSMPSGEILHFYGTGGDRMQGAGVELLCHIKELASIGPCEAVAHALRYYGIFRELVQSSRRRRPAVALLLDFPEFNLRLAKKMKRAGIPVIYYISPQLWAWRGGRVRIVRRCVDEMLVILPFEEDYYRKRGVRAQFVGHPLLEDFAPETDRERFLRRYELDPAVTTLAILPGSRRKEVDHILPTLVTTAQFILRKISAQFLVSVAPTIDEARVRRIVSEGLRNGSQSDRFRIVSADSGDVLANVDFALVKSGTSTLEAALAGTPFLITYKISPISWFVGNILVRTPYKGLVNLIAEEEIVPELLQEDATPERLSQVALQYLETPEKAAAMKARLAAIREKLSIRCASDTVAAAVRSYL